MVTTRYRFKNCAGMPGSRRRALSTDGTRSAAHGLAADRDNFGKDGDRDLVGRYGAKIEACRRLKHRQPFGGNAALRQRRFERFGFLAAADESNVGGLDGKRGQ